MENEARILTADENFSIVEAVPVRDGKFLAVGQNDRILSMAGSVFQQQELGNVIWR